MAVHRTVFWTQVDEDGNHYISVNELGRALELVGIKIPGYQVRDLLRQHDVTRDDRLDFDEFKKVSETNPLYQKLLIPTKD